jgi:hypothetical protein
MDKAYEIKSYDIVLELVDRGYTSIIPDEEATEEIWLVQAPQHYSTTKAKKIISTVIRLYSAAKERSRAQIQYEKLLCELEQLESQ